MAAIRPIPVHMVEDARRAHELRREGWLKNLVAEADLARTHKRAVLEQLVESHLIAFFQQCRERPVHGFRFSRPDETGMRSLVLGLIAAT